MTQAEFSPQATPRRKAYEQFSDRWRDWLHDTAGPRNDLWEYTRDMIRAVKRLILSDSLVKLPRERIRSCELKAGKQIIQ